MHQKTRDALAAMHQKTMNADAMATAPSAQATHAAPTATQVTPVDTLLSMNASTTQPEHPLSTEAMTMDPQQPLAMQPPGPMHTVSSNSTTIAQSKHTAETSDRLFVHQTNSRRTNWRKLKELASMDRSKRRDVLIAVNSDTSFCCSLDSNKGKSTRRQRRLKDMSLTRTRRMMMPTTTVKKMMPMISLISQRKS